MTCSPSYITSSSSSSLFLLVKKLRAACQLEKSGSLSLFINMHSLDILLLLPLKREGGGKENHERQFQVRLSSSSEWRAAKEGRGTRDTERERERVESVRALLESATGGEICSRVSLRVLETAEKLIYISLLFLQKEIEREKKSCQDCIFCQVFLFTLGILRSLFTCRQQQLCFPFRALALI